MKFFPVVAVATATVLGLSACAGSKSGGSSAAAGKLADGKTFTLRLSADPGSLDPSLTSLGVAFELDRFLYDSLINVDKNGKIVSGLASKWTGTTTGATYTLRKGVSCADGATLTASDVAANINFVANPKNKSTRLGANVQAGASAVADDAAGTVTVTSPVPDAFLTRNVGSLQIVCARGLHDRTMLQSGADGTGMFSLTQVVADDHYTLTRRKDYAWGPGDFSSSQPGLPDKVVAKVITNETTAANLMLSGALNQSSFIGPDKPRLQSQKLFQVDLVSPLGELWFNEKAGEPGSDEAVRRALTQALDLDQLGKVITSSTGKPATGLIPPGLGPCTGDTVPGNVPSFDEAAANAALDAAGWQTGSDGVRAKNGKKLSMLLLFPASSGAPMQGGAELLQKQWKSIGVQASIRAITDVAFGEQVLGGAGSWDATILPFGIGLPTQIVPYISGPTPPKGANFAGIDNAEYNSHVQKASVVAEAAGCPDWEAAEKALYQHVDLVPFVNSVTPSFGKGASFDEPSAGDIDPTSIRMYAN